MSSISGLSSSYLQSILNIAVQRNTSSTGANRNLGIDSLSGQPPDSGQLSPFAQLLSTLQQLQQSDPSKYKDVMQKIATNLEDASKTASANGNTTLATKLDTLATDFTNASQSGDLPNIQDLAKAVTGGMHHNLGPAHSHASSDSCAGSTTSTSSSSTDSSTSAQDMLRALLASLESAQTQTDALNPMNIIMNTLSDAGVNASN